MLCATPYSIIRPYRDEVVPCGKCICCRINRRREWTGRILLELGTWEMASFATLTYDEEHVPWKICDGMPFQVLVKSDIQRWLKRLRKRRGAPALFRLWRIRGPDSPAPLSCDFVRGIAH